MEQEPKQPLEEESSPSTRLGRDGSMVLEFSMTEPDCLALMEDYFQKSPVHQKAKRRARWTVPVIFSFLLIYVVLQPQIQVWRPVLLAAIMIGWAVFYPARFDSRVRKHTKAQMKESSCSQNFGDYQVRLSESTIASVGPTGRAEHNWTAVDRASLTPDYLFLFFAGMSGLPIPISQVGEEKAAAAFELVQSCRTAA